MRDLIRTTTVEDLLRRLEAEEEPHGQWIWIRMDDELVGWTAINGNIIEGLRGRPRPPVLGGVIETSNLPSHPETTFDPAKTFPPSAGEYFRVEVAIVGCPTCSHVASLTARTHRVLSDGTVRPSFVCPGCDFHAYIRLENWSDDSNG